MRFGRSFALLLVTLVTASGMLMLGTPVQAQSTNSMVLLHYQARGWVVSPSLQSPGTNPFSRAAFGSGGTCPLDPTVHTFWPANTTITIWHEFQVPRGATNVQVAIAIDNDVNVWVNGVNVSGGFQMHEGCAQLDAFIFSVPSNILHKNNVLEVRGRDRGVESYLDAEVRADV
jgi:hypothetical protein